MSYAMTLHGHKMTLNGWCGRCGLSHHFIMDNNVVGCGGIPENANPLTIACSGGTVYTKEGTMDPATIAQIVSADLAAKQQAIAEQLFQFGRLGSDINIGSRSVGPDLNNTLEDFCIHHTLAAATQRGAATGDNIKQPDETWTDGDKIRFVRVPVIGTVGKPFPAKAMSQPRSDLRYGAHSYMQDIE